MAKIVFGLGTAHSTQCNVTPDWWREHGRLDSKRIPAYESLVENAPDFLQAELTDEVLDSKHDRVQSAIDGLAAKLQAANPDVLVVFGDDQHELFLEEAIPAFAIFVGQQLWDYPANLEVLVPSHRAGWWAFHGTEPEAYKGYPDLATHLVQRLTEAEFDITRFSKQSEGRSLGHAWTFVRRRLMKEIEPIPMIPFALNTYFPPNQPTSKRCYAIGAAVREAIEAWDKDVRVAVIASGGLSHRIIDEEFDRRVIAALQNNDRSVLETLPMEKLQSGTSETLNWIAAGGALSGLRMNLIDYVPGYRSLGGTGCGMTFAYWE